MKSKTKFKGKIWKTGNSNVITIPSNFIEHGMLKEGQECEVEIK